MFQKMRQEKFSSLYVLNHFKYFLIYILRHLSQKQTRKIIKIHKNSWTISSLHL